MEDVEGVFSAGVAVGTTVPLVGERVNLEVLDGLLVSCFNGLAVFGYGNLVDGTVVASLRGDFDGLLIAVGAAVFSVTGFFVFDILNGVVVCSFGLVGDDGETAIDML